MQYTCVPLPHARNFARNATAEAQSTVSNLVLDVFARALRVALLSLCVQSRHLNGVCLYGMVRARTGREISHIPLPKSCLGRT
eukprot:6200616-Pleurochrysis_carterae.AAC.3